MAKDVAPKLAAVAGHAPGPAILVALRDRLRGPGGYYNLGNALALGTGIAIQVAGADGEAGALEAVRRYLVGSPSATALTLAIFIFLFAGEMYFRAWAQGFPPDRRGNWWGDFLSGVAALVLTYALAAFGDVLLALASGALLAAGKFGSALLPEDRAAPGSPWPYRFRLIVLLSRFPAFAALGLELVRELAAGGDAPPESLLMTGVMLVCYGFWTRADSLLFRPCAPAPAAPSTRRFSKVDH